MNENEGEVASRNADLPFQVEARTDPPKDGASLGKAFGGGNELPAWEKCLRRRERHEEEFRLTGGIEE